MLLMGPSRLLKFPTGLGTVIMGYPLLGICQVFVFIPIIPEMLERLQVDLKICEDDEPHVKLNDMANEAYVLIYAISSFLSPLIGSYLYTNFGM